MGKNRVKSRPKPDLRHNRAKNRVKSREKRKTKGLADYCKRNAYHKSVMR